VRQEPFSRDVAVIGGGGHVGLPLALIFADAGLDTLIYDVRSDVVSRIRSGEMPFLEDGAPEMLRRVLARKKLEVDDRPDRLRECKFLILIVGTPVDEHMNPTTAELYGVIDGCRPFLREGQILILRSTVYPGISEHIQRHLAAQGLPIPVAFCPERVAQGRSLKEFRQLPQIISAFDPGVLVEVRDLFGHFVQEFIEMKPMEAELTKLMTNAWRYLQFATVNQFYMIAADHGLDFDRILHGCRHNYPRMAGMMGPGFAAGPCLVKDTMQLAAFCHNNFVLGHAAMLINEGLPMFLVAQVKREMDLSSATAGILGMAFKADSDDTRDSLSYKLRKLLELETRRVLCSDPFVSDPGFVTQERVIEEADVLFIGAPHTVYRDLVIPEGKRLVDVWNCVARHTESAAQPSPPLLSRIG
jgi:UDP-N-acetyl-D-mannosaminuronic acid dehydrogenase